MWEQKYQMNTSKHIRYIPTLVRAFSSLLLSVNDFPVLLLCICWGKKPQTNSRLFIFQKSYM